jgi:hypothetical protein
MADTQTLTWMIYGGFAIAAFGLVAVVSILFHAAQYHAWGKWQFRWWCMACWVSRWFFRGAA